MQIALVGIHLSRDANGNAEMKLVNLEHFRAPSDDVMMTTTTSTPEGRIFLGGNDGHLYELEYRNQSSWLRGRCNKVSKQTSMHQCPRDTSSDKCSTPIIAHCGHNNSTGCGWC